MLLKKWANEISKLRLIEGVSFHYLSHWLAELLASPASLADDRQQSVVFTRWAVVSQVFLARVPASVNEWTTLP